MGATGEVSNRDQDTRAMALVGVGARVFNAACMFLTQLAFARILGVAEYGVFTTANTAMLLAAGTATFGLAAVPQRYWPEYAGENDRARLRGLLRFSLAAPLVLGTIGALIAAAMALATGSLVGSTIAWSIALAMLTIPAQASMDVLEGLALARGWKLIAYGAGFGLRPLLVPLVFIALWLAGHGADATAAILAITLATWIAAFVLAVAVVLRSRTAGKTPAAIEERGRWLATAWPVALTDAAFMLMTSLDILLLAMFRTEAEVGVYGAAARLVALVAFVHHGLSWATGHHFSALHQAGDKAGLAAYAARATRLSFLPSLAGALIVMVAAPFLLMLFGKAFTAGGVVTSLLLLGLLARAAVGPAEQLLIMTDHQTACAYAFAWAFLVTAAFGIALIPTYGAPAAAIATSLGYGVASLIMAREVRVRLGFDVHLLARHREERLPGRA